LAQAPVHQVPSVEPKESGPQTPRLVEHSVASTRHERLIHAQTFIELGSPATEKTQA
jgi:hypothetical protein